MLDVSVYTLYTNPSEHTYILILKDKQLMIWKTDLMQFLNGS